MEFDAKQTVSTGNARPNCVSPLPRYLGGLTASSRVNPPGGGGRSASMPARWALWLGRHIAKTLRSLMVMAGAQILLFMSGLVVLYCLHLVGMFDPDQDQVINPILDLVVTAMAAIAIFALGVISYYQDKLRGWYRRLFFLGSGFIILTLVIAMIFPDFISVATHNSGV